MKRSLLIAIAVLLIAALFVGCNADKIEEDYIGSVFISSDMSRSLDRTGELDVDVENLYWYYTAAKSDSSMFTTGSTDGEKVAIKTGKGLSGTTLPGKFSTGAWTFGFYGYTAASTAGEPAYYQEGLAVTVTKDATTTVTVALTPGTGMPDAKYAVSGVTWEYDRATENTALQLVITYDDVTEPLATLVAVVEANHTATFSTTAQQEFSLDGEHTLYFKVIYPANQDQVVGEALLAVNGVKGMRYTIINSGTTIGIATTEEEGTIFIAGRESSAEADFTTEDDGSKEITTDISPSESAGTKVSFPAGSLDNAADYSLSIAVYPVEAASGAFIVDSVSNAGAVAAIDLDLSKAGSEVTDFNGESVIVTTYITTGLSGVAVVYDDNGTMSAEGIDAGGTPGHENEAAELNADSGLGYNTATGYLSFSTNHFSSFYVGSSSVAVDVTTGIAYDTLAEALVAENFGHTIKLLKDVDLSGGWSPVGSTAAPYYGIFDGNNKVISNLTLDDASAKKIGLFGSIKNSTIKNLSIVGATVSGSENVGILSGESLGNLIVENVNIDDTSSVSATKKCAAFVAFINNAQGWQNGIGGSTRFVNCINAADVSVVSDRAGAFIGCIYAWDNEDAFAAGHIYYLENCANTGTLTISEPSGWGAGLIGYVCQGNYHGQQNTNEFLREEKIIFKNCTDTCNYIGRYDNGGVLIVEKEGANYNENLIGTIKGAPQNNYFIKVNDYVYGVTASGSISLPAEIEAYSIELGQFTYSVSDNHWGGDQNSKTYRELYYQDSGYTELAEYNKAYELNQSTIRFVDYEMYICGGYIMIQSISGPENRVDPFILAGKTKQDTNYSGYLVYHIVDAE